MMKILIVEDEQAINDLIALNLKLVGYKCIQVFDGKDAKSLIKTEKPDLVLLDVMIPNIDGFSLMESNIFKDIPVIFVTAKDNLSDKVKGLKCGADDYITKPFEAVELLARVEAVLRRVKPKQRVFSIENTTIYLDERVVTVNNIEVNLTNRDNHFM